MSAAHQGALARVPFSPSIFNFGTHPVRIVIRDGEPWFVANDVCAALGYVNTSKAVADHLDGDERSTITNSESRNGGGRLTIINESGLYALVLRSRKPEARRFAKWVTGEVLPSIRKTGRYDVDGEDETTALERALNGLGRWFLSANGGRLVLSPVPDGAYVIAAEEFPLLIREPGQIPAHLLPKIIAAAAERLVRIEEGQ